MNLRIILQLVLTNFLQFFVWGAWLITIANYWFGTKQWGPSEFGAIFTTLGLSSLFMPTLAGYISDKYINAERLFGVFHLISAGFIFALTKVNDPHSFFYVMLGGMLFYMPTIALCNSISYNILTQKNVNVIKIFPFIRVFGTIGFIVAMWLTNGLGFKATQGQFYVSVIGSIVLGISAFLLPACPPKKFENTSVVQEASVLGALKEMLSNKKTILFLLFSMFLGAALQLTNMYGDLYIDQFKNIPKYTDSFVVKRSTWIMSISQISETLFILAIPFFLKRFGIKIVMLISMIAWVLRFGLLAYGNPSEGLWMIIASCIVYGMAFDFFNISGSLYIETNTSEKIRSSAQGVFMMVTNGLGAIIGSYGSGFLIENFLSSKVNGVSVFDWQNIWIAFAIYALIIAVFFLIFFRHKHDGKEFEVRH